MLLEERWMAGNGRSIELEDGTYVCLDGLLADARLRRGAEVRRLVARIVAIQKRTAHVLAAAVGKSPAGRAPGVAASHKADALHKANDVLRADNFYSDLALGHFAGESEAHGPATVHTLHAFAHRRLAA
jgi:hypothetical protein